ncbi:MAG: ABC transporter permease [Acidimicrobiia bacterium]|nr:ABC transporter permease [Acidimicrobiia bacterium]
MASAARRGSAFDHAATGLSYLGFSMPVFWLGLLLQLGLVVYLREWFDVRLFYLQGKHSTGNEGDLLDLARHMVLPVLTLSVGLAAAWSRYLRDSTVDALRSDFVRTARAKGASRRRVVWGHAWRASLVPFATVVAIDAGALVGGAVVTERIFGWPGMGTLFLRALSNDDYPVLLAWMAVTTVAVVLFNLVADLLYGVLDPRVRYR